MSHQVCETPSRAPAHGLRDAVLAHAERQLGSPYLWPCEQNGWKYGKGQKLPDGRRTFDCSGLVSVCLVEVLPGFRIKGQAVVPAYWNADKYMKHLVRCDGPDQGPDVLVLALYGVPTRADHIELVYPDGRSIGASGGRSSTYTLERALARGACVKQRPHYTAGRSKDFLSLYQLPLAVPAP